MSGDNIDRWIGKRNGDISILRILGTNKYKKREIEVLCSCGARKKTLLATFKNGLIKSCGCQKRARIANLKPNLRHGMRGTRIYNIWVHMRRRCRDKNFKDYKNYGARGIKVCSRWEVFENFYKDMGEPISRAYSIDRINNDGDYEPNNCRWATAKEQANNRRRR